MLHVLTHFKETCIC